MSELKPLVLNPPMNITRITDVSGLEKLREFLQREKSPGWDVETNPLKDFFWRRCRTIQFGNLTEQYVIDLLPFCDGNPNLLFNCQGQYGKDLNKTPKLKVVIEFLKEFLESREWLKIGVNLGFEYTTMYWNFGIRAFNFFDCSVVERCIWAGAHSLKDYSFYGMQEMFARYFGYYIEKELQESFTLDQTLTDAQYEYAALDTRTPLSLRAAQMLVLKGFTRKTHSNNIFNRIDPIVTGDNLEEIAQIENDCIGSFQDMHIHGERIDREKWLSNVSKRVVEKKETIIELDKIFIPLVGMKENIPSEEQFNIAKFNLDTSKVVSLEELELRRKSRKDAESKIQYDKLVADRKTLQDKYKEVYNNIKSRRTKKYTEMVSRCEGEAFLNYSSPAQLLEVLKQITGLKSLKDTNDDTLEQFDHIYVIKLIQKFRGLDKEIGTYGTAWATEWTTHPCKEEGWLHPGDGRIHHVYNQYDAETGRSSSEQPNGQNIPLDKNVRGCYAANLSDEEEPDGYVYVTADMSGAELRIIAELADDPVWIGAFSRGEDVHSVGTEMLFVEEWPALKLPDCNYFKLKPDGNPQRKKCGCPEHVELRNGNKSTNFLLAYGGGPAKLARELKKAFTYAKELMAKHERAFPNIWAYLDKSGKMSRIRKKSFDMFNRRRIFPDPTWARAKEKAREDRKDKLEYTKEIQKKNKEEFFRKYSRKPVGEETWILTHREPTSGEIGNALQAMSWSIERQGKNHAIQGTNATIAKIAMAILFHQLPKYKAKLVKFVHDELVVMCPKRFGETVAKLIGDAFKQAAALKMKKVVMEFDYHIALYWMK